MNEIREGSLVFGCWTVTERLGSGSYGAVYKIRKNQEQDLQGLDTQYAALKVIYIPKEERDVWYLQARKLDQRQIHESFKKEAEYQLKEINLMYPLRGHSNIVGYDDSQILPQNSGIGYMILIRMELLTPIVRFAATDGMHVEQTIQLGIDICQALEACEKLNIIHRDIKPDNIFVNRFGSFKLGDFGIARTAEGTTNGTVVGTYNYMAPEVFNGKKYNATVDIYSLGIVLYQYLNDGRLPFEPPIDQNVTVTNFEMASAKRFSGEPIPAISGIDPKLSAIVCKACNYNPDYRYQSAGELKNALLNYRLTAGQASDFDKTLPSYGNPKPPERLVNVDAVRKKRDAYGAPLPKVVTDEMKRIGENWQRAVLYKPDDGKKEKIRADRPISHSLKKGEIVKYGTYKQKSDRLTAIEWIVLDVQDKKALLISKYGLDAKPYNKERKTVTWEDCTLRMWLNHDFLNAAFTDEERDGIVLTPVVNEGNPRLGTRGGNDTDDYIFCLSLEEAGKYFTSDKERSCYPTQYAIDQGVHKFSSDSCWWWLRSPGGLTYGAAYVNYYGALDYYGYYVDDAYDAVRPALWVEISNLES